MWCALEEDERCGGADTVILFLWLVASVLCRQVRMFMLTWELPRSIASCRMRRTLFESFLEFF